MLENKVRELIQDHVLKEGVVIDNISYEQEGGNNFLRIVIDKDGGVDLDTCVSVTNVINPILDNHEDMFNEAYILEVTSKERGDSNE